MRHLFLRLNCKIQRNDVEKVLRNLTRAAFPGSGAIFAKFNLTLRLGATFTGLGTTFLGLGATFAQFGATLEIRCGFYRIRSNFP